MNGQGSRILVTGASGFVGRRLIPRLTETFPAAQILAFGGSSETEMRPLNLLDRQQVEAAIAQAAPSHVVHLAGQSSVGSSLGGAAQTWATNLDGTVALADAVRKHCPGAVFIFASSAEVYGESFNHGPRHEGSPILPRTPYARSKAAAEGVLEDLLAPSCPVIALRLFNHTGPGQDERFAIPSFASQIAQAEAGLRPAEIAVGNLSAERDFSDVDDILDAYLAVIAGNRSTSGFQLFNVGSGRLQSISSVLDKLVGLAKIDVTVRVDQARVRPVDIPRTEGVFSAFKDAYGWAPRRSFETTLSGVLSFWRARVQKQSDKS
jgi:GDP-4-dehydro-6-deoxy-D-mannose reductase